MLLAADQRRAAHLGLAALNGAGRLVQAAGQAVVGQRLLHHHLLKGRSQSRCEEQVGAHEEVGSRHARAARPAEALVGCPPGWRC